MLGAVNAGPLQAAWVAARSWLPGSVVAWGDPMPDWVCRGMGVWTVVGASCRVNGSALAGSARDGHAGWVDARRDDKDG